MRAVYLNQEGEPFSAEDGLSLPQAKREAARCGAARLRTFTHQRVAGQTITRLREYEPHGKRWREVEYHEHHGGNEFMHIRGKWVS